MSENMSTILSRLKESSATLNQLCDRGADSIRDLEEFLAKECSVGIEASVPVWSEEDEYHGESLSLRYARWGNQFRVLLEWSDSSVPSPHDTSCKPWAECKREDKLLTLPKLADLLEAIEVELNLRVSKAAAAIEQIAQISPPTPRKKGGNDVAK
ncbi:MAG TPA: hypothetical protein VFG20_17095 [Planctomycetaceae bacterium]|jgi:hypothetical protein|nr:hypothetical protein [Planctomycetaceae bacterium]